MTFFRNSYDFLFDVKEALGADLIEQVFLPVPRWFSGTGREKEKVRTKDLSPVRTSFGNYIGSDRLYFLPQNPLTSEGRWSA